VPDLRVADGSPTGDRSTRAEASAPIAAHVTFVGHATVLVEVDGFRFLTDPFLRLRLGPLRRHGTAPNVAALEGLDAILISHAHPDHFDPRSLVRLGGNVTLVVPAGLGDAASKLSGRVVEMRVGDRTRIGGATITAVPARHWRSPRRPAASTLGYVVECGATIYFAGDTGPFDEIVRLAGRIDLALLPVWSWGPHLGPGHLGPDDAAEFARAIRPAAVVPIHWGTLYPSGLHRVWARALTEPGDRFAASVARLAPAVDVRVLRPGEETTLALNPRSRSGATVRR
jgi:L-ascorbate metabolism protein UlaG (beta-lactamase superfamily)